MTRSFLNTLLLLLVTSWIVAPALEAQLFTPSYMAPRSDSDVGLYLSDGPGDFAIEGILRRAAGGYDLGVRLGVADAGDLAILIGGEVRNPLDAGAPIDLAITGSAQGVLGGVSGAGFLVGLTLGHTLEAPGLAFTPYLHPRLGPVRSLRGRDVGLELLADFGFDVRLANDIDLRFGIGFADAGPGWGLGLAWR